MCYCLTLTKIRKSWQILAKHFSIKYHENQFSCFQVVRCRQADRQTDRHGEVKWDFCNFHCKYNKQWICNIICLQLTYSLCCDLFNQMLESFILSGSVTMKWHVLGLWMNGTASRYGGWLWTYWICSCGQLKMGGPPAWELDIELITPLHKTSTCYKTGWEGVGWNHLAQDRDMWHVLVNTRMILQVP